MKARMTTAIAFKRENPPDDRQALSTPTSERPVDLVHLSRFTLGDETLEREVLQLFRVQARLCLERMRQAGDRASFRQAAHTIKGSAQGIGAWAVAAAAQAIEQLDEAPSSVAAAAAVDRLKAAVDEAVGFIGVLLTKR